MKITTSSLKSKKTLLSLAALLIVVAMGYVAYASTNNRWPFTATTPKESSVKKDSPATNSSSATPQTNTSINTDTPASSTKTPINHEQVAEEKSNETVTANITAANQYDNTLQIRTLIEAVSAEGECKLTLSKGNQIISHTAGIHPLAHSSSCKGFDIPTDELSPGQWNITIDIHLPNKEAHVTKTITIT